MRANIFINVHYDVVHSNRFRELSDTARLIYILAGVSKGFTGVPGFYACSSQDIYSMSNEDEDTAEYAFKDLVKVGLIEWTPRVDYGILLPYQAYLGAKIMSESYARKALDTVGKFKGNREAMRAKELIEMARNESAEEPEFIRLR